MEMIFWTDEFRVGVEEMKEWWMLKAVMVMWNSSWTRELWNEMWIIGLI